MFHGSGITFRLAGRRNHLDLSGEKARKLKTYSTSHLNSESGHLKKQKSDSFFRASTGCTSEHTSFVTTDLKKATKVPVA